MSPVLAHCTFGAEVIPESSGEKIQVQLLMATQRQQAIKARAGVCRIAGIVETKIERYAQYFVPFENAVVKIPVFFPYYFMINIGIPKAEVFNGIRIGTPYFRLTFGVFDGIVRFEFHHVFLEGYDRFMYFFPYNSPYLNSCVIIF